MPNPLNDALLRDLAAEEPRMIADRRHLHRHPEPSFQEFATADYVARAMAELPGAAVLRAAGTSVLVRLKGDAPGPTVALRADIDALPVREERPDLDFASENEGCMHACGHDGHTAVLMAALRFLARHRDLVRGEIVGVFQAAEELPPGGAKALVEGGYCDDFDFIYGQHFFATVPLGRIDVREGHIFANTDFYRLRIQGRGGHSSAPQQAVDPVIAGMNVLAALQQIISRRISARESAVISNTFFRAGHERALNVIPDFAELGGSVRSASPETRATVRAEMERAIAAACALHGARFAFDYEQGYDTVYNQPEGAAFVRALAEALFPGSLGAFPLEMGGEDFSAYAARVPACYAIVGSRSAEGGCDYPHHHPKFALHEAVLPIGLRLMAAVALGYARRDDAVAAGGRTQG